MSRKTVVCNHSTIYQKSLKNFAEESSSFQNRGLKPVIPWIFIESKSKCKRVIQKCKSKFVVFGVALVGLSVFIYGNFHVKLQPGSASECKSLSKFQMLKRKL